MLVVLTLAAIPFLASLVFLAMTISHARSVKNTDAALLSALDINNAAMTNLGQSLKRLDNSVEGVNRAVTYPARPHRSSAARSWSDVVDDTAAADSASDWLAEMESHAGGQDPRGPRSPRDRRARRLIKKVAASA